MTKKQITQYAKNIHQLKTSGRIKSTLLRVLLCTYLNGRQLRKLGHLEDERCRHCQTETHSIEHFLTECIMSSYIADFIQATVRETEKRNLLQQENIAANGY